MRRLLPRRVPRHVVARPSVAAALAVMLGGCFPGFAPTPTPMPSIGLVQRTPEPPCTAILLPGMLDSADTFRRQGFADLAVAKAPGVDIIAADAHFGYYRKAMILTRLHEDLVGPEVDAGRRVYLVGTSLGGIGSLLYARGPNGHRLLPDADRLAGLVLLAPFLGEDELIADIEAAGDPLAWRPPEPSPGERGSRADIGVAAWTWLREWHGETGEKPRLVLGWGEDDDLARAARLAARLLPPEDVFERPGDHDWKTWRALWSEILDAGLFDDCAATPGG